MKFDNNPFSPRGGMKRLPFVLINLVQCVALGFLLIFAQAAFAPDAPTGAAFLAVALGLLALYSVFCTVFKRCCTVGISGWWAVVALVPLVCAGVFAYLWAARPKLQDAAPAEGALAKARTLS